MNSIAAKARAAAMSCEAKKHAYRQVQDGVVVSFVLHPQEVPEGLAIASLGTRYMLALVEVDDNELPKGGAPATAPGPTPPPDRARTWNQLAPAQQAGMLCGEAAFQKFLTDDPCFGQPPIRDADAAASAVRELCGVLSRTEIEKHPTALARWKQLVSAYRAWQREPEVVG